MAKTIRLKNSKYGNKIVRVGENKFDSKLEMYCFNMMKQMGIDFKFQDKIVLVEAFRYNGQAIREIALIVDFVLERNGVTYYIDTKGFATDTSTMKYKMLKHRLKDSIYTEVVWLKNQKEVQSFIRNLIN
jgi:protein associated with RNAse G/E